MDQSTFAYDITAFGNPKNDSSYVVRQIFRMAENE
jgi:hypothetical protein